MSDHETYMAAAFELAQQAAEADEVPIGAVIVNRDSGEIIAKSFNQTITLNDPTAHAEILAIREACQAIGAQRIPGHDLYVTLEPCAMCAAAISFARIDRLYFGAHDPKSGGVCQGAKIYDHPMTHHKPEVTGGIMTDQCGNLLSDFFKSKRGK